jgi:thymidylate synthase (FAD)
VNVIDQRHEWIYRPDRELALSVLEQCGRESWQSFGKIGPGTASKFVRMICKNNHLSVLRHVSATARIVTSRAVSMQILRHATGVAVTQESQRYVRGCDAVSNIVHGSEDEDWREAMGVAEVCYQKLLAKGWKPEDARDVLPNAAKTSMAFTANLEAWKHVLTVRTASDVWPQTRSLIGGIARDLQEWLPEVFS